MHLYPIRPSLCAPPTAPRDEGRGADVGENIGEDVGKDVGWDARKRGGTAARGAEGGETEGVPCIVTQRVCVVGGAGPTCYDRI